MKDWYNMLGRAECSHRGRLSWRMFCAGAQRGANLGWMVLDLVCSLTALSTKYSTRDTPASRRRPVLRKRTAFLAHGSLSERGSKDLQLDASAASSGREPASAAVETLLYQLICPVSVIAGALGLLSTVGCKSFGRNIRLGFKQQQQDLIYNHLCLRK